MSTNVKLESVLNHLNQETYTFKVPLLSNQNEVFEITFMLVVRELEHRGFIERPLLSKER